MKRPKIDWTAFLAELPGIRAVTNPQQVRMKSKDFFWYSPVLNEQLKDCAGDVVLMPADEAEVIRVAAACARWGAPVTVRGGGTGNYGQAVPLEGGVILDVSGLNRVIEVGPGRVRTQAGIRIAVLDDLMRAQGQALLMWPSTRRIATIGGFIAGGSAGIGSVRHGILRDEGNVTLVRVVTVEREPRVIELRGADIQKVHHAYGTNGVITELELALAPAVEWRHVIVLFEDYLATLRFGLAASPPNLDLFLLTTVDRRYQPYYPMLGERFPANRDAVFAMVAPSALPAFRALAAEHGGHISLDLSEREIEEAELPPAYECAYNHTTLHALKVDKSWTYLQLAYPQPFDPALVARQMQRFGDEVYMHHELARQSGELLMLALPLVKWSTRERLYEIIRSIEADGCLVFDPHVYTIEEGGMKEIDERQIAFKRIADPMGLMNPGKTLGWTGAAVAAHAD